MKKNGRHSAALVFPGATGWRLRLPTGQTQSVAGLADAAAALPSGALVHLALPCTSALLERMTLPSIDRDELSGMVLLQLEKTLPYPVEDVSSDFVVITQAESESTLLSVSANHAQLDRLCEPLKNKSIVPEKVTVYAQHVAATCPADETVLCLWPEDEQLVVAVCERGKLGYAQTIPQTDPAAVTSALPALLLRAEMEGVPTEFARVRIEQGCGGLRDQLAALMHVPVDVFSFDESLPEPRTNLVPAPWLEEMRRLNSTDRSRGRLQLFAMLYLLVVAAVCLYLVWLKRQVQQLDVQLAQTQPLVEFQQSRQAKWQDLAPAIDPSRSAVEVLNLLTANLPSKEVKFTLFEFGPKSFKIEGEAPNANLWTEFTEKLRKEPGMTVYKLDMPQPQFINTGVKFTVFGR
ncbi:MAG: hypothetical protein ABMA13_22700 [Chthoniobacteraceae bacterium]